MRGTSKGSAANTSRRTTSSAGKKKNVRSRKPLCCQVNPVSCYMTKKYYDNIRPCSGLTDFCKEHLAKRIKSEGVDLFMNMDTLCNNCKDYVNYVP